VSKDTARRIVRKVLDDLLDRRGFRQVWDGCDQQVKADIRRSLVAVVENELAKPGDRKAHG
jgi:hypothetical protein